MKERNKKIFTVAGTEHRDPLLKFLAKRMAISNGRAKDLLDQRLVFVNNQRIWMAKHPLAAGQKVEVHVMADLPQAPAFTILYEDTDYLIADKPAGLLTNGPQSFETLLYEKKGDRRIEAIHRLDRETSGCLLFAKNAVAREAMLPLFQQREIKKVYRALVFGSFSRNIHIVKTPIEGQEAVTQIRLIKSNDEGSELELTIETGRTHQIRKHLAELKHPVIGDKAYQTHSIESSQLRKVSRQMLHACLLEFKQPRSGQHVRVESPLPADYAACRRALRLG